MVKAATSGQARAFNAMTISCINEEVLEQIDNEKFQKAIDNSGAFIHNLIRFINNDCHVLTGPLVVELDREPVDTIRIISNVTGERILFSSGKIKLVKKWAEGTHLSSEEYRKRIEEDSTIGLINANIIKFCEDYQYDPEVADFLAPYKGQNLYQFGTICKYNTGRRYIFFLRWNGKCWISDTKDYDNNWVLQGFAFVLEK